MTHPRKGSIVRCPLFENDSIKIGLFAANPISDLCGDVESQSLDAVVLPFVGVFAKHDAPGRHVIGTPSHAVFIDAHRPYRIAFPGAIGDRAIVIRFEDALVPCGIDCGRDGETLRSNALLPADTIIRRDRLRQRLSDPMRDSFELETMGIELLGQCLRARRSKPVPLRPAARLRRQRAVERVKEAVATAPAEAWSIAALAKIARLSPFHLCHAFRGLVGTSLYDYVLRERLAQALNAVVDGDEDITGIALNAGFASHSHFTARFRRFFGCPPVALRNGTRRTDRRLSQDRDSAGCRPGLAS